MLSGGQQPRVPSGQTKAVRGRPCVDAFFLGEGSICRLKSWACALSSAGVGGGSQTDTSDLCGTHSGGECPRGTGADGLVNSLLPISPFPHATTTL